MTIVWAGLSVGAIYVIIAVGYNTTLALGGVFNFAQGAFVILGAFLSWFLMAEQNWPWWAAAVSGALVCALVATAAELVAIRPVLRRKGSHAVLVTTVGVAVVIEGLLFATWGAIPRSLEFFGGTEALTLLGGRLAPVDFWLIIIAIVTATAMHLVLRKTRWGLCARAASEDAEAAAARGINVPALRTGAFAVAGGLAGLLGPVIGPKAGITVSVGISLTIFGFIALAIGGFGSFLGTLLGGFFIGLIQALCARYLGVEYPPLILFVLLLAILLLKPTGLFGRRALRTV